MKLEFDSEPSASWQIPYSTLMTILMIFFMVLYAYQYSAKKSRFEKVMMSVQKQFGYIVKNKDLERLAELESEEDLKKSVEELKLKEGLKKFTHVKIDKKKIRIILEEPILFNSGKAELKPDLIWVLGEIANVLRKLPKGSEVLIEGHTDNRPLRKSSKFSSNWELSIARSLSVVRYLVNIEGLDPKIFVPVGYGEFRPLFPNDTEEHRAQNRRIEIAILRKS